MGYNFTPEEVAFLRNQNVGVRWHDRAVSHEEDQLTGKPRVVAAAFVVCDVFDKNVAGSPVVCQGRGSTEAEAWHDARAKWDTAPKPLTPSQAAMGGLARQAEELAAAKQRIAELEMKLSEAGAASKPKAGGRKPREEAAAS